MENVSSSNGLEKRPKLRFPSFDKPYILHRIGDIYAERSEREAADMELLSVTMNDGVMQRSEIEGKDNSSEDKSNYKVVRKGDMVYNSMRMWQGANGVSSYDGIVSPAYTVLTAKVSICNEYFAALFKNYKLINEFRKNSQGMTSDTWNSKYPQIETIKVYLPEVAEQEKVASMLVTLDKRIAAQVTLVEQLKKYKRGLLTYAFEEMTLSDDADSTTYLFSEIAQRRKEKYNPDCNVEYPCIELEHIEQGTGRLLGSVSSKTQSSIKTVAKNGDVLFGKLRPYLRKFAFAEQDIVCSSEIWAFVPSKYVIPKYLYYLVQTEHFLRVANISSGTKMPRAEWANIEKEPFDIPYIPNQEKVVSILEAVDKKISVSGDSLRMLLNFRDGLLQQLFI